MFESITKFFRKLKKAETQENNSKETAKERLHLVLMQDRANVSADFLEMMKQEIIEVIKKYIDVDENAIDVRLTNKTNDDGTNGAPALYANIPIISIKEEKKEEAEKIKEEKEENKNKENEIENLQKDETEKEEEKEGENKKDILKDEADNNVNETNNKDIENANKNSREKVI